MTDISPEIDENYQNFIELLKSKLTQNIDQISSDPRLKNAYARAGALNAIKLDVSNPNVVPEAQAFLVEAHNDILVSLVTASFGSWRSSLQSLRSALENTMACIYYAEHPVELYKWSKSLYYIQQKHLRLYILDHPNILKISDASGLKQNLGNEYETLSKAVHASNSLFRMTDNNGKTNFASVDIAELGKWSARERAVSNLIFTMLIAYFHHEFDGAKRKTLRESLSRGISQKTKDALNVTYSINIK